LSLPPLNDVGDSASSAHDDRVVQRDDAHASAQPDPPGALRRRRHEQHRGRQATTKLAAIVEVMFGKPDAVIPEVISLFYLVQHLGIERRIVGWLMAKHHVEQAKLHRDLCIGKRAHPADRQRSAFDGPAYGHNCHTPG